MKKIGKKLLLLFVKFLPIHKVFKYLLEQDVINDCIKQTASETNVTFHNTAIISNQQFNKTKIIIKSGSHIAGTLLVFGYGGEIKIGRNCYLGDQSRIWSGERVQIGDNVLISHGVNIMDTNGHELDYLLRTDGFVKSFTEGTKYLQGRVETKPVIIEDDVWIGFNSVILKGVLIGRGAIIAAGSIVTKNVEPFTMVGGNPARTIKKLNR